MLPKEIQNFIEKFSKLPSIGPRLATRLAFHIIGKDKTSISALETAILHLKNLERCGRCFFLKEKDKKVCDICGSKRRDASIIVIVEKETDLIAIEKTGSFNGQYLVLGELSSKGVLGTGQKLRLKRLKKRIDEELGGKAKEIIIALALNSFGDFTSMLIEQIFKDSTEKITRIGRGIPTGGEIEFADEETLKSALRGRK